MKSMAEICKECGGKCCKHCPGAYTPEDFGLPSEEGKQKLEKALNSGNLVIDWYEGDSTKEEDYSDVCIYYVRPAMKGVKTLYHPAIRSGECIFLTDTGCKLEETERPAQCISLTPTEDGCHNTLRKRHVAILWIPYQNLLTGRRMA